MLNAPMPEEFSREQVGSHYTQPRCPSCESLNITLIALNRALTFGLMYFFGVALPIPSEQWHCDDCGHKWRRKPLRLVRL